MAAAARLEALEALSVLAPWLPCQRPGGTGLDALAHGPSAPSLRHLACPLPPTRPDRMRGLERLPGSMKAEHYEILGRLPLAHLAVSVHRRGGQCAPSAAAARSAESALARLAACARSLPPFAELTVDVGQTKALAAALEAARPLLVAARVESCLPLSRPAAQALARCAGAPRLVSLELQHAAPDPAAPDPARAYEPLAPLLAAGVRLRVVAVAEPLSGAAGRVRVRGALAGALPGADVAVWKGLEAPVAV
eukprot:tig00001056_g6644.t1